MNEQSSRDSRKPPVEPDFVRKTVCCDGSGERQTRKQNEGISRLKRHSKGHILANCQQAHTKELASVSPKPEKRKVCIIFDNSMEQNCSRCSLDTGQKETRCQLRCNFGFHYKLNVIILHTHKNKLKVSKIRGQT